MTISNLDRVGEKIQAEITIVKDCKMDRLLPEYRGLSLHRRYVKIHIKM